MAVEIDLSTAFIPSGGYGAVYSGGAMSDGGGTYYYDFILTGLTLDPAKAYEFQVDFGAGGTNPVNAWFLSQLGEDQTSYNSSDWYDFGEVAAAPNSTATVTFGPGFGDWENAVANNEMHILVEGSNDGSTITGMRYQEVPVPTFNQAVVHGMPTAMDNILDDIREDYYADESVAIFENFYPSGCRVWDDVVIGVWGNEYRGPYWHARAARMDRTDLSWELGPILQGPTGDPLNGGNIAEVRRLGPGLAVIVCCESYGVWPGPAFWVVSVDEDTLAVSLLASYDVPNLQANSAADAWTVTASKHPDLGRVGAIFSYSPSTYSYGCVTTGGATFTGNLPLVPGGPDWSRIAAVYDAGDFIYTLEYNSFVYMGFKVYRHSVDGGGLPSVAGTLIASIPVPNVHVWDHTYMGPMPNGKILIISRRNTSPFVVESWVLDPSDGSFEGGGFNWYTSTQTHIGSSAHLMDWVSFDMVDDDGANDTCLVGWGGNLTVGGGTQMCSFSAERYLDGVWASPAGPFQTLAYWNVDGPMLMWDGVVRQANIALQNGCNKVIYMGDGYFAYILAAAFETATYYEGYQTYVIAGHFGLLPTSSISGAPVASRRRFYSPKPVN